MKSSVVVKKYSTFFSKSETFWDFLFFEVRVKEPVSLTADLSSYKLFVRNSNKKYNVRLILYKKF